MAWLFSHAAWCQYFYRSLILDISTCDNLLMQRIVHAITRSFFSPKDKFNLIILIKVALEKYLHKYVVILWNHFFSSEPVLGIINFLYSEEHYLVGNWFVAFCCLTIHYLCKLYRYVRGYVNLWVRVTHETHVTHVTHETHVTHLTHKSHVTVIPHQQGRFHNIAENQKFSKSH